MAVPIVLIELSGLRSGMAEESATWRHGGEAARDQLVGAGRAFLHDASRMVVPADHDAAITTPLRRRVSPPEPRLRPVGDGLECSPRTKIGLAEHETALPIMPSQCRQMTMVVTFGWNWDQIRDVERELRVARRLVVVRTLGRVVHATRGIHAPGVFNGPARRPDQGRRGRFSQTPQGVLDVEEGTGPTRAFRGPRRARGSHRSRPRAPPVSRSVPCGLARASARRRG